MIRPLLLGFRWAFVIIAHCILFALSIGFSFLLRFEFSIPAPEAAILGGAVWLSVVLKSTTFLAFRLDRGWWSLVGLTDLLRVFSANCVASGIFASAAFAVYGREFPRTVYIIDFLLSFVVTAGARFAVRVYNESFIHDLKSGSKGVLIYGAGNTGVKLVKELAANRTFGYKVLGFLDDDPKKWNETIAGVPVFGPGSKARDVVDRFRLRTPSVEEIIIAMPRATSREMREAVAHCRATGVSCKTIPGLSELLSGKFLSSQIRKPSLTDLLGREPVQLEIEKISEAIRNRSVLVTGGAGSIGSELCRQVAGFQPARLVMLDQAESDLYRIDLELRQNFPALEIHAEIGDIREIERVDEVMGRHEIDFVFHAAAYKHVPMMEHNICEAAKNNVLGTWNVVRSAMNHAVPRLLLISTDKAVRPTSIMGVTKRISELLVSAVAGASGGYRNYVAVRFGNVLGSNGSVIPLFEAQIASGGPVTVTHPEVKRYFMTIREAVQLVLQASTMGNGSEVFVLDMGEPLRIADVARNMIRLSGLVPDEDIEIRYVGLRPGEKLYEELITEGENIVPTMHQKIKVFQGAAPSFDVARMWVRELERLLSKGDDGSILSHMEVLVPEYNRSVASQPLDRPRVQTAEV